VAKQQSHSSAKKLIDKLRAAAGDNSSLRPPLERLVALYLDELATLRTQLKWNQIANALDSWRQKDGTPVSSDQLRGVYSRTKKRHRRTEGALQTQTRRRQSPAPEAFPAPAQREAQRTASLTGTSMLMKRLERTMAIRGDLDES
jgi:hypothetical protein